MTLDHVELGRRVRQTRKASGLSQKAVAQALGLSQQTYSRIESGDRPLAGDELVVLADALGVRAAAVIGLSAVAERARSTVWVGDSPAAVETMRSKLHAYLELDAYLTSQGIP